MTAAVLAVTTPHPPFEDHTARIGWRHHAEFLLSSLRPPQRPALYLIDLHGPTGAVPEIVLAAVETLLHGVCRRSGTALRLPRGQFLLLHAVSTPGDAHDSADQLVGALTRPLPATGPWVAPDPVTLDVRIGVAVGPGVRPDLTALFWAADAALYRAMINGRPEIETLP